MELAQSVLPAPSLNTKGVVPASSSVLQKVEINPTSSTTYTVGASNQNLLFEIPPSNYNFSKSYLSFTFTAAAAGAGVAHMHYSHIPPIQQMQFRGQGGNISLVDLSDFGGYWAATRGFEKQQTWQKESPTFLDATAIPAGTITNSGQRYHACSGDFKAIDEKVVTCYRANQAGAITAIPSNATATQYVAIGSDATASAFTFRLDFSQLYGTVLALDKVIPCRQRMNLVLSMATLNQMFADIGAGGIVATTAAVTVTTSLTLMQEVNPIVNNALAQKVDTGNFDLLIPYVSQSSFATTASTRNTAQFNNSANGAVNLLGHLISPMIADSSAAAVALRGSAYDFNGVLIQNHQGLLNNFALDVQQIDHTNPSADDWRVYEKFLRKGAVNQSDFLSLYKVMVYWYGAIQDLSETNWDLAQGYNILNLNPGMFQLRHLSGATASNLVCNAIYQISVKASPSGLVYNSSAPVNHIAPTPMPLQAASQLM